MLVISRRQGESILIGEDVEIVVTHIGRSRVRVGIRAPRETPVTPGEIKLVRQENLAAAGHSAIEISSLVEKLRPTQSNSHTSSR
jgi:carbon storage regulator